jgi:hypothetical protein
MSFLTIDHDTGLACIKSPMLVALLALGASAYTGQNGWFVTLFIFRYLRLIVHIVSHNLIYRPSPIPEHPTVQRSHCTVIIPTVDPSHERFTANLESILRNQPSALLIVTVGTSNLALIQGIAASLATAYPRTTNAPRFVRRSPT